MKSPRRSKLLFPKTSDSTPPLQRPWYRLEKEATDSQNPAQSPCHHLGDTSCLRRSGSWHCIWAAGYFFFLPSSQGPPSPDLPRVFVDHTPPPPSCDGCVAAVWPCVCRRETCPALSSDDPASNLLSEANSCGRSCVPWRPASGCLEPAH